MQWGQKYKVLMKHRPKTQGFTILCYLDLSGEDVSELSGLPKYTF